MYDRRNVARPNRANTDDPVRKHELFNRVMSGYRDVYKYFSYSSEGFKKALSDMKQKHRDSKFVVFTTPVSRPMFCLLAESGLTAEYEHWLRDVVDIFGRVYHFEYLHSVADNYDKYFYDPSHFEPVVGAMVADRIMGRAPGKVPADFGMVIDKDNVDKAISLMRQELRACAAVPDASH